MVEINVGTLLLIIVGVVLAVVLIALLGGGMATGGMMMMAGMMGTPVGWVVLLILAGLIALIGYVAFFAGA